jgi:hypothetical protein
MTFNIPSFFAGIAATLGILTVGFGGGVMMSGVLSDGARQPNRIERQAAREPAAKETKEIKPTTAPVVVTVPAPAAPAEAQAAAAVSAPEPVVSPTIPPQTEPPSVQPAPAQQTAAQAPALGPQRPVSLAQPVEESRPSQNLSRREEARRKAQQWREERAQRREERRKQMAERRRQEETRRAERIVEQNSRPDADEDDDEQPVVRQPGFLGGPFGLFR